MMNRAILDRRGFLKLAGVTGSVGLAGGFVGRPDFRRIVSPFPGGSDEDPRFEPVRVSADRIIKTVVGLRPYRSSGFVLKTEKINDKLVVHNYGHGGGGVSLSWGTAAIAVEEVQQDGESDIAVAGCGVIGLSTALLLQVKGFKVKIYTRDLPPDTTSNTAGALWGPVSVYEEQRSDIEFLKLFYRASKISHRIFQEFADKNYGIWWIKNYSLGKSFNFPGGKDLYTGFKIHRNAGTFFGYSEVQEITAMMIETPIYLKALLEDFCRDGGEIVIRIFDSFQDIAQLPEKTIMNCTGLGARKLFNDEELIPVKGQLTILSAQPEIDYSYFAASAEGFLYMLPRKDGIVLGGTSEKGNWSMEPDQQESERIIKGHAAIAASLKV